MAHRSPASFHRQPNRRPMAARRASLGTMKWLLLITIAVVLAKIVAPSLTSVYLSKTLEATRDRATIKMLETAINGYRMDFFQWPALPEWKDESTAHPTEGVWLEALLGNTNDLNLKGSSYLSLPTTTTRKGGIYKDARGVTHLVDQYGHPFMVQFDFDGDGKIPNPNPKHDPAKAYLPGPVLIYSGGADGKASTWTDNTKSWD